MSIVCIIEQDNMKEKCEILEVVPVVAPTDSRGGPYHM